MIKNLAIISVIIAISSVSATAGPVLFQGTFSQDDQVELFSFTSDGSTPITIESYGYAGGLVNGNSIAAGGFAPNIVIFDSTGAQAATDQGGHTGNTSADPVTGNYDDPYISQVFAAGVYDLALIVWDNVSFDGTLADGFKQDGNPGFTCAENGVSGNFCDVTDPLLRSRTGDYDLSFAGVTAVTDITAGSGPVIPEPSTVVLIAGGLCLIALFRARLIPAPILLRSPKNSGGRLS
jgi:hypothetical protein